MNAIYDNAPRPIRREEAEAIAARDYACSRSEFGGWMLTSRGADFGMHFRRRVDTPTEAETWVREQRAAHVERILGGHACIAYNPSLDQFYSC